MNLSDHTVILTEHGINYQLYLPQQQTDYIQKSIVSAKRPYELGMLEDMRSRLSPGDKVIDVGANVGNHTLYLSAVAECHVSAFEPNAMLCEAIQASSSLNELENRIEVHKAGVGEVCSRGHFANLNDSNLGAQSIETTDKLTDSFEIVTLDSQSWTNTIRMIKIDVEGFELAVLKGAKHLIEKDQPILYIECQTEEDFVQIHEWLGKYGYDYWDTFNATPTHSFIHESQLTQNQKLQHLSFQTARQDYRSVIQVAGLRNKLDEANHKYRRANNNIAELKTKLNSANEKYRSASERVNELKQSLTAERGLYQTSEQALADTREQLLELERQAAQQGAKLQAAEQEQKQGEQRHQELKGQLQQAKAKAEEVAVLRQKLDASNEKYRQVTGSEIPALKERLATQTTRSCELQEKLGTVSKDFNLTNDKRLAAEKRILELRSSLTYKSGYLLRNQSRSLIGLLKLPVGLWRLYRQSRMQRLQRLNRGAHTQQLKQRQPIIRDISSSTPGPEPISMDDLSLVLIPQDYVARELRVACIMDGFTFASYQQECRLQQLTPSDWQAELESFAPELLFIESAWRGKDELWGSKVGHRSEEVQGIIEWCKKKNVSTVFWNKEDPVHFETFLNTAKLFDFVFTTDMDCIHRYKAALGHDRVYFLPFACQPAIHNPIEKYHRKDAFCFAGAYYVRYPSRTRDLESFVDKLPDCRPLEIYDRNYGKGDPNYQFPENYQPYIVGTLPFSEIDKAYKGYNYAINLNSIKQSQTMFARRVYELLASNTLTISNFSRGVRLLFGDLVVTSDDGAEVVSRLKAQAEIPTHAARLRLAALRKVMQEHTYGERIEYLLAKVFGHENEQRLPTFSVVSSVKTLAELEAVIQHAEDQQGVKLALAVLLGTKVSRSDAELRLSQSTLNARCINANEVNGESLAEWVYAGDWIAAFLADDYYGPNYLLDMVLATRYSHAAVIGKAAYHGWDGKNVALINSEAAYRPATALFYRASIISREAAQAINAKKWVKQLHKGQYQLPAQLAIDSFNYCQNGSFTGSKGENEKEQLIRATVDDLQLNTGLSISTLINQAESIEPVAGAETGQPTYEASELAELMGTSGAKEVSAKLTDDGFSIASLLADGKHEYLYAQRDLSRQQLMKGQVDEDILPLYLDMEPGLNVSLVLLFLDADKQRISHKILQPNRNHSVELPFETSYVRFGLRVYAGGEATIKRLIFAHRDLEPVKVLGQFDVLLLTNHYPSYDDLYRNGFVHSRVKAYQERGFAVDVFRLRMGEPISWHEFQDVDVATGSQEALRRMLASGQYRHVLVHFLDADMWQVLSEFIDRIKVTVWVHGAEVQPWWRREFNFETEDQRALAKIQSEKRLSFWRSLLDPMPKNLKLVFVSDYLAQVVMEDLQLSLPQQKYQIIHNPINTDLFCYQEKSAPQRKKLLSIRPYASRTYANDLTVEALLELSKESWFDELEIRLVGDGPLFDETLEPLKKFSNITLEKRFLTQDEIAQYHKEYGIFLCPSRMDTQGVSRDEAMASGLVPVTNAVAAIPEFADDSCAILAPEDDAHAMAEGIRTLYRDAQLFLQMSENASERVKRKVGQDIIVKDELSVLER